MSLAVRSLRAALRALAAGGSARSLYLGTAYLKRHPGSRTARILSVVAATLATGLAAATLAQQGAPPTRVVPPASTNAAPGVTFVDMTAAAGLSTFRHVSGSPEKPYVIEVAGSGVAVWDFDGDGFVDIYLVNGGTLDPGRGTLPTAPPAALYRNNGDGTFRDVTETAGVGNRPLGPGRLRRRYRQRRREDIYVTNFGPNRLYRAVDKDRFADIAESAGVAVSSWSTGCAFGDYDADGWLDLFVAGLRVSRSGEPAALTQAPGRPAAGRRDASRPAGEWAPRTPPARPCASTAASR